MNKKHSDKYTEDSIQVLKGLTAVRKRPGMYIGSVNQDGLHHLIWEILDNAIDEVIAGFADTINITLLQDHAVLIEDNGRGIPTGINKQTKLSTVDTVFTTLHAGGKFGGDSAYKVSGGLHGVGSSVVNALSERLIVEVYRDHKTYQSQYKNGGEIVQALKMIGKADKTGTKVYFKPDSKIFPVVEFKPTVILERLKESSYLFKNLTINFTDLINNTVHRINSKNGIASYVEFINEGKKTMGEICLMHGFYEKIDVQIALQYSDEINETIVSFANSVKTRGGGSHETGLKSALTEVLNIYGNKNKLFKPKQELETSDILEGLAAVVAVQIPESLIMYEGQTKSKLFTAQAKTAVYQTVIDQFSVWLNNHKLIANNIIKKCVLTREARFAAKKAREEVRNLKNAKSNRILAGKIAPCQSKKAELNEIFLVEGESAGGSAKTCREKKFQAILPLKGKIINVEKAKLMDLLKNEEIASIINALGAGFGKEINLKTLNYHKIIIMTDADNDGAHIQSLLLTLFYRYMKPLIENGHVYLANSPLYLVKLPKQKQPVYLWNNYQLNQLKKQHDKLEIKRFKGLGEMQPEQLWETTMDPERRQLIQVTLDNVSVAERRILVLMGDDPSVRKTWINDNINFTLEEGDEIHE